MAVYEPYVIKSFKHDGHLHRVWLRNWRVPADRLHPAHAAEAMAVLINDRTPIREADGRSWTSKVPAVSFFLPGEWFNVVALLETDGVRYYCNVASPPFVRDGVLTYIDYDLDVIRSADGSVRTLDRDEYEANRTMYRYTTDVRRKVEDGLRAVSERIAGERQPFDEGKALRYYRDWQTDNNGV